MQTQRSAPYNLHARQMLTNSQDVSRLLDALGAAGIGVWNWDLASNTVTYSPEWKDLRGCSDQGVSSSIEESLSRVHAADRPELELKRTRLVAGEDDSLLHEYRVQRPDESWIFVEERTRAIRDDNGSVVSLVGCEIDLTERCVKANAKFDQTKRDAEDSKELHQRLHSLLASCSIGIWEWHWAEERLVWDEKTHEIYGVDPNDFRSIYSDWSDRIHPADLKRILTEDQCRSETNQQLTQEYRIVRPNGDVRHIYSNAHTEFSEHGKPIRATGVNVDVTEHREAELALLESKNQLQRIAGHIPGMVFRYFLDAEGNGGWSYLSPQVQELFGIEPSELIANKELLWRLIDPTDMNRLREKMHESANEGARFIEEFRVTNPEKSTRWFLVNSQPSKTESGGFIWDGVILEITDRKTVECELQDAKTQLERITENVPGMIFRQLYAKSGGCVTTFVSSKSLGMFGVKRVDALADATNLCQWIHRDDMASLKESIDYSVKRVKPLAAEYRVTPPNEGTRWYHVTGQPEALDNGDVTLDGVVLDITHRKQAELQLQLANDELARATKMKDEFLANMSHELRTPLSAILGMTEGLQHGLFGSATDKQQSSFDVIEQSASHLLALINEVLDLAKIESGSLDLKFAAVDIPELCKSSLQLVAQQAGKKNIQLNLTVPFNSPVVEADEKRIRQVLINLLSNAVKFTPNHGQVALQVVILEATDDDTEERVRFSVTDTGIGLDQSYFDSLFEPFTHVDTSLNRNYEGTGLGLALVKQFVELHFGHVKVTSELGVGSCFSFEMPLRQPGMHLVEARDAKHQPKVNGEVNDTSSTLVLLAEDNELVAKTTTLYLEASNFGVQLVTDGQAAIDAASENFPDVILMDVQMPGVDGIEAIRRLRELPGLGETPIIALTGLAMPGDSKRCLDAGANHYVSKPYCMEELVRTIRKLLP